MKFVDDRHLQIDWNDGQSRVYSFKQLRDACPCATCREKRAASDQSAELLPVLGPGEQNANRVTGMRPVGSYAYAVVFADGHDSGIYTFELLRELGEAKQ
jgi:DUF971 family protein